MRILFIGGTRFLGRFAVEEAIRRGHDVTLFHRGTTGEDLFPDIEHVHGDRLTDLGRLAGLQWDAAFDLFAYVPRGVQEAARVLGNAVDQYWLVSSVAVYRESPASVIREDFPTMGERDLDDPATEEVDFARTFGPLKGMCEASARSCFGGRAGIIRPSFMVGPCDPTDRFTWWVRRIGQGGEVLAAAPAHAPAQVIDARDVARFVIRLIESGRPDTYHCAGPREPMTVGGLLGTIGSALRTSASLTWVDPDFLSARGVNVGAELGMEVPLWNAPRDYVKVRCDPARAIAAGLSIRPLVQTIADTHRWDIERGRPPLATGLSAARESELLQAWKSSR